MHYACTQSIACMSLLLIVLSFSLLDFENDMLVPALESSFHFAKCTKHTRIRTAANIINRMRYYYYFFERNFNITSNKLVFWYGLKSSKTNQFFFYCDLNTKKRAHNTRMGMRIYACVFVCVAQPYKKPKTRNGSCIIIEYRRQKQKIINHKLKAINNYRRGKTLSKFCE